MKSLYDRGFLFLLSSTQMVESKGSEKLFLIFSSRLNHLPAPLGKVRPFETKKKPQSCCLFCREVGAVGEEPASIIHLPGVKDGCEVL